MSINSRLTSDPTPEQILKISNLYLLLNHISAVMRGPGPGQSEEEYTVEAKQNLELYNLFREKYPTPESVVPFVERGIRELSNDYDTSLTTLLRVPLGEATYEGIHKAMLEKVNDLHEQINKDIAHFKENFGEEFGLVTG